MPGFDDFVPGEIPAASKLNDMLMKQVVGQYASDAARDSALSGNLRDGMYATTLDNDRLYRYNGSAWVVISEPAQAWTPVITQGVTVTATNNFSWYQRSNGVFTAQCNLSITGAGTAANTIIVVPPFTLADANGAMGSFFIYDASSTLVYAGTAASSSTTAITLYTDQGGLNGVGNSPGLTLAASDTLKASFQGRY